MIINDNGGRYKEPEPSFVQPISSVDKNFVNVVIDRIVSVKNMHFIYLKSTDPHVKMNLGTIAYIGDLKPGIEQGSVAIYTLGGEKIDFYGWTLFRDENNKWVFKENLLKKVVPEVKPQPVQQIVQKKEEKPKEPVVKPEELCEIFNFYLETFTILSLRDYDKLPQNKKEGTIDKTHEQSRELRRLLRAAQMIIENGQHKSHLVSDVIRNALIENGILKIRSCAKFVRRIIIAWNRDVRNDVIDEKGVFLRSIDKSGVLDIDWNGIIPSTEPDVFKRIEKAVKKRQFDKAIDSFDAGRFIGLESINKRRRKTL